MLEWVQTIGHLIISWPVVAVVVLVVFRGQVQMLFARFSEGSGSKASLGPLKIELGKLAEDGRTAVSRINRISEAMAESRLLELEITEQTFGATFTEEQRGRMNQQIETLRSLTAPTSPTPPATSRRKVL
jgi:hypothetical protein